MHYASACDRYRFPFRFKGILAFFTTLLFPDDHHGLHYRDGVVLRVLHSIYDAARAQTLSHRDLLREPGFILIDPVMETLQISHK